ncbi:MAG: hypothetical protein U0136_10615 [Bdellovibrionota bacterium]
MKTNHQNERGAVMLESALLLTLIALACVGNLYHLGQKLNDDFLLIGRKMEEKKLDTSNSSNQTNNSFLSIIGPSGDSGAQPGA